MQFSHWKKNSIPKYPRVYNETLLLVAIFPKKLWFSQNRRVIISLSKNGFFISCKNLTGFVVEKDNLPIISQDNAILVIFLQVNTFLARFFGTTYFLKDFFQGIHFLQDTYKNLARNLLFPRMLQEYARILEKNVFFLQKSNENI